MEFDKKVEVFIYLMKWFNYHAYGTALCSTKGGGLN